jgi:hypothetical protein
MSDIWNLIRIELYHVRLRILAFWGIYAILGFLIGLIWFDNLPSQENVIRSWLKFELKTSALDSFLETPPYLILATFCATLLGPSIILLVIDMIPTEITTGQLLVMKTSGTNLQRIYITRALLIIFGFLPPHLLIWGLIHILSAAFLVKGSIIFYDAIYLSLLQYLLFSLILLGFLTFCILLAFILSITLKNQITSAFLAIFTFLIPEITQSFLYFQEINFTVSFSALFSNLYYSVPSSDGKIDFLSASNSYAFIGLIGLFFIAIGMFLAFNWMMRTKEVY